MLTLLNGSELFGVPLVEGEEDLFGVLNEGDLGAPVDLNREGSERGGGGGGGGKRRKRRKRRYR